MRIEEQGTEELKTVDEAGRRFVDELFRQFHNDGLFLEVDQLGEAAA